MANVKITDLTALSGALVGADLFEMVDDVAGTPASRKVTAAVVRQYIFGEASRAEGTGSNQTIASTSTFTKVTCLTTDYDSSSYWDNTDKVMQPTVAGRYLLLFAGAIANIDDGKRIIFRLGVDETGGGTLDSANAQSFDLLRGYSSVASGFVGGTCAVVVEANGTRSFGVLAWQDSGATAAVNGETGRIGLYMQYMGPII